LILLSCMQTVLLLIVNYKLLNQMISSFSLSKSVHPHWWYDWMWSILTLTSELCECFAKVLVTIFQSLNGKIRN
jgi:hypothetical protein